MTPMKNYIKVEVTNDADDGTSENFYVENTVQNPAWHTAEDNQVSLTSENVEKVIKVETDLLDDDCMWESRIEISNVVSDQNNVILPVECQDIIPVRSIDLNDGNTSNKIFYCKICGKGFDLNYLLKQHLAEHKRQVNNKTNQCKVCGKQFKLKFGLNRHIQKYHYQLCECKFCGLFIEKTNYNEHIKSHKKDEARVDIIPNIKLRKLNGVWKSKANVFKCNICFQTCDTENNFVEHMETHDNCQTQCDDCSEYVSVSEFSNHMLQIHNKNVFKCQKCNRQFEKQQYLNRHSIYCLNPTRTKWNKCRSKFKANAKTCSVCGIVFNNSLLLKNHQTFGCKNYSCKYCGKLFSTMKSMLKHKEVHEKDEQCVMSKVSTDKKSIQRECNQTEVINNCWLNGENSLENITGIINADQTDFMNSNESSVRILPHNLVVNNINRSKEKVVGKRNFSHQLDAGNSNESITHNKRHNLVPINSSKQKKVLLNNTKRNSSDQMDTVNCNESNDQHDPVANNFLLLNIKQENSQLNMTERNCSDQMNSNESTISIAPHNSIANSCLILNIKQEIGSSTIVRENNSSDEINLATSNESAVSNASNYSMVNNFPVLNIKQENNACEYMRENSNLMDVVNSNESTVSNSPHDLVAEQNPINLGNNIAVTLRETPYFCIKKLPFVKNIFTPQDDIIFLCKICQKTPSTDIHSFALHMSYHSECNMHECIVCDKTFNTVSLWKNHMNYHEQQKDLNLSPTDQINTVESESNILDPIISGNIEPQVCTTLSNKRIKKSTYDNLYADSIGSNNSAKNNKNQYKSSCKQVFPSKISLEGHHNISHQFACRYCKRIFSGKGQCTNHEKSHTKSDQLFVQNNQNSNELIVIQNNISMVDNNIGSETISTVHKKRKRSSIIKGTTFCNLCNKKFAKRCYFTNHMIIKHNINPNAPKQLTTIDSKKSVNSSQNIELSNEYDNKLSFPVDNNFNNHVNKSNEKKSPFCTICKKHFAHHGALTNHKKSHSNYKPYKCQYCDKQFNKKGNCIIHENQHVFNNEVGIIPSKNENSVIVEVNEEQKIENCDDFLNIPFDGNLNTTNTMKLKRLWFPCDVCEKKYSTPFQLNVHRKFHSDVPYVCKICNKSYTLKFRWNWHLKGHYMKRKENYKIKQPTNNQKSNSDKLKTKSMGHLNTIKCQYCKKEYNMISQWKKHLTMSKECRRHCKSNLPEYTSNQATKNFHKPGRFKCNICLHTYSSSYNRNVHIQTVHNKLNTTELNTNENNDLQKDRIMEIAQHKPVIRKRNRSNCINGIQCNLCYKTYSSGANLRRHVSIIHTKVFAPITCNVCNLTFKHKFTYREHLKIKHKHLLKKSNGINHTSDRTNLHIVSVNKNKIIEHFCKICKIKFADNIALQVHSKIHTVDLYTCIDCGQQFETNVTLGNHILENHNVNTSTSNKNKHTENYESQNTNQKIVNNNPSQCKICLKILKDPKYLHKHMRLHTGVKPFKCNNCNMAFRFKPNLKMHEKKCMP